MTAKALTIQQKKDYAKMLFIKEKLTQKEIAKRAEVSERTISKWVNDENWERQRKSLLLTREEQLTKMYNELDVLNLVIEGSGTFQQGKDEKLFWVPRGYANKEQAYIRDTLVQNIQKLETETSIADINNVAVKMIGYWRTLDLAAAQQLTEWFDVFIKSSLK